VVGIIYSYEHNGKYYVGKTYGKERKRKNMHKYDAFVKKANTPFANAIRKYGWEEILKSYKVIERYEMDDKQELNKLIVERETYWIGKLNCIVPNGYNVHLSNHKMIPHLTTKEERYKKTSESLKGKYMNQEYSSKPVICIETGVEYPSVSECERQMGFKHNTIGRVLRGKGCSHKGYTFKYKNQPTNLKKRIRHNKPVICIERNKEFRTTREASIWLCGNESKHANLRVAIEHNWICAGYHWKFKQDNTVPSQQ